jgi:hypothetical protein
MGSLSAKIFPPRPDLPADITTLDILKSAAVVLMIIDHVGWLLFPQFEMLRVLGRLCVPLWFFLIGYARSRDIPARWMVGGIILLASSLVVGLPALPLSVLFTMALIRLCLDPFWRLAERHGVYFWWFILLFVFFGYVTNLVVEYGTLGFALACCGYAIRHRQEVDDAFGQTMHRTVPEVLMMAVLLAFGFIETLSFGFSIMGVMVLTAGLLGEYFILQNFEAKTLPGTAGKPHAPLLQFMGRYTLEIYVIHILILKGVFGLSLLADRLL